MTKRIRNFVDECHPVTLFAIGCLLMWFVAGMLAAALVGMAGHGTLKQAISAGCQIFGLGLSLTSIYFFRWSRE